MSSKERVQQLYPEADVVTKTTGTNKNYHVIVGNKTIGKGSNSTVAWWDALRKINSKLQVVSN